MYRQPQTSTVRAWKDAPTGSVDAAGTKFVYRQLGPATGVPVILLNHWGAVLDNFDPRIVDGLAATRHVIALNYRGVGASGGTAPLTVAEMAQDAIATTRALGFEEVDLIGFSLGGFVAQEIVRKTPDLVRKIILAGTGPAGGTGIEKVGSISWPLILKGMLTFRGSEILSLLHLEREWPPRCERLPRTPEGAKDRSRQADHNGCVPAAAQGDQGMGHAGATGSWVGPAACSGFERRPGYHGAQRQLGRHGAPPAECRTRPLRGRRPRRHLPVPRRFREEGFGVLGVSLSSLRPNRPDTGDRNKRLLF
jgi:pimeloyl-ACP methyl ester carboxylesterase